MFRCANNLSEMNWRDYDSRTQLIETARNEWIQLSPVERDKKNFASKFSVSLTPSNI